MSDAKRKAVRDKHGKNVTGVDIFISGFKSDPAAYLKEKDAQRAAEQAEIERMRREGRKSRGTLGE